MSFTELLCAAYDHNRGGPPNTAGMVSREDVLEYIDAHTVENRPNYPTTALHWDLIRTFGASEGRKLLLRASRRWDAKPLRARDIVFKWSILEEDYEPQAWVDEYLADVIGDWRAERDRLRLCAEAEKAWLAFNGVATRAQLTEWQEKFGGWYLNPQKKLGPVKLMEDLRKAALAELKTFCGVATQAEFQGWLSRHAAVASTIYEKISIVEMPARQAERLRAEIAEADERVNKRRFNAASLADEPVPERKWLVPGLIPADNVTLLYGDGGTGKSLLALQLAVAKATGSNFFGRPVSQGGVEFISAEDSRDELHMRLVDICKATGKPLDQLDDLCVTSLVDSDALLAVENGNRVLSPTHLYQKIERVIQTAYPDLLVLDTLADTFGGNEINRAHARQFVAMLRKLCIENSCTVIVLAHPSLSGMDKGTSGSTGWNNSVRSRLFFTRVLDNDGTEIDEDARVLRVGKLNYGRVGVEIPMRWKAGAFVAEGSDASPDPLAQRWKAERVFLDLLGKATAQNIHVSAALTANNYAPKVFARDAMKDGVKKRDLADAMQRLLDAGRIENAPYGPPSRTTYRLQVIARPQHFAPPLTPFSPKN